MMKQEKKYMTVKVKRETWKKARKLAIEKEITFSQLVEEALNDYLNKKI